MLDVSHLDNGWRVMYIAIDREAEGTYIEQWRNMFPTFSSMPRKTKEAVAVLAMCANGEQVSSYGTRVSESTYWIDSTPERLEEYDHD